MHLLTNFILDILTEPAYLFAVSREDLHGFFHRIESLHNSVKIVVKHTLDHWMKITGIHLLFTLSSRFCVQTEVDKRSRNTYEV